MPYVYFAGFQDPSHLPKYYGVADVFVLPSQCEPWGLVVNEAMASGLPVIATGKVGAARDLIVEGENGYLVPENDPVALASAIDRACESEQHLLLLGEKARGTVQSWNYDSTLAGFHKALCRCFGAKNSPGDDSFHESRSELGTGSDPF
jgi:glycosyltransferase involved in cell wall biosynthesis